MESAELEGSELGVIKYISEISGWDVKKVANLFILLLIFVFDPLAITLIIATNQAFKGKIKHKDSERDTSVPHKEDTIHNTVHDEVEVPEVYFSHITEVDVNNVNEKKINNNLKNKSLSYSNRNEKY